MSREMEIFIDKLYRYDRKAEPCSVGFPLKQGELTDLKKVCVLDKGKKLPLQVKATSKYPDGSVRFLFLRLLADIPANKKVSFLCRIGEEDESDLSPFSPVAIEDTPNGYKVFTKDFSFEVENDSTEIFKRLQARGRTYEGDCFKGPSLRTAGVKGDYDLTLGQWSVVEAGPVCAILKVRGMHRAEGGLHPECEIRLTAWAGKPYTEVSYRVINASDEEMEIESLRYRICRTKEAAGLCDKENNFVLENMSVGKPDSTGCGDSLYSASKGNGPIVHAGNSDEADAMDPVKDKAAIRTIAAISNYRTDYLMGRGGERVSRVIDGESLLKEANEHFAEVFYGTFFADCTDEEGGVCATIYQAQQNYPKALLADTNGIMLMLVPEAVDKVVLQSGMSRETRMLFHFHQREESIQSLNDRSIVYQMPYRPYVSPKVHAESGVWPDVFAKKTDYLVEQNLIGRADGHCRAYGMLNFGDSYDANYTAQGRGGGRLVWCNNEYDYPHACALLYARTGIRRFLDYTIASCSHWMDVDVCHYHRDPLYIGGQWEHTAGHVINGVMVCSHEWVEGLLDYYHLTGDERGLETAIGIGQNVQRLLDMPMYAKPGEANARETGWALRTLTALYVETCDPEWLIKSEKIVNDFKIWEEQYGHWLAPYTDNTVIRVGFMISIAIGSLMRYYRHFPSEELKNLMLRAVDDMIENCYVKEWGIFYYKELPSLNRLGNNTLLLEALTVAYDLSKDSDYLMYGMETFRKAIIDTPSYNATKRKTEDAVLVGSTSSKNFAQSMIPIAGFYRALVDAGITF